MTRKSIMVIEDDDGIRKVLTLALELEGYKVSCAANGKEGLALLTTVEAPCLILLDLMMPVMNGWDFLRAKQRDEVLAVIPVVILSAFVDQARDEKVQGFVKKPVDLDVLQTIVRKYCD